MTDLVLLLMMFVVCGGLGAPIAAMLPAGLRGRVLVAPVFGVAVMSVTEPVAYRWGLSIPIYFWSMVGLAVAGLVWRRRWLVGAIRELGSDERHAGRWLLAAWLAATLLMMLPRWVGGEQFSVFQGNMWDVFGYLESAVVYARKHYAIVADASDDVMRRNPLYPMAQGQLRERPSVHLLYAAFSRIAPGQAYRLYYTFLVGFFSQFVLAAVFVLRALVPRAPRLLVLALALAFPLGFWGQYAFDINAWSQVSSASLFFVLFGLVLYSAVTALEPGDDLRLAGAIAVIVAGAAYLYPEGFIVYAAALGPVAAGVPVLRMIRARRFALRPLLPATGFAAVASIALYPPLLHHVIAQVRFGNGTTVWWWRYFQAFFYGRDGVSDNPIDFVAGLFGLYFATPSAGAGPIVAVVLRALIAAVVGSLVILLVHAVVRGPSGPERTADRSLLRVWLAVVVLLALPAAYLLHKESYWAAGKLVSYAAPVYMTLFLVPLAWPGGHRAWRPLRWLGGALVAFQLVLGVTRIGATRAPDAIHYASPYPSVTLPRFKQEFGWDLRRVDRALRQLPRKPKVRLAPMDPWPEIYLSIYLYSHGYQFSKASSTSATFGAGRDLGVMPQITAPDVEISCERTAYLLHFRDGRRDIHARSRPD